MSKREFEAVAAILAAAPRTKRGTTPIAPLIEALADFFGTRNKRFDRGRFCEAAGHPAYSHVKRSKSTRVE